MVRAFLRATRSLKSERAGFIAFAEKKFGYHKDMTEEAYKVLVDAPLKTASWMTASYKPPSTKPGA